MELDRKTCPDAQGLMPRHKGGTEKRKRSRIKAACETRLEQERPERCRFSFLPERLQGEHEEMPRCRLFRQFNTLLLT